MPIIAAPQGVAAGHECKGRITAKLAEKLEVRRIIRYGGCNGSHTVQAHGLVHSFSHYGSTFSNVHTTMVGMVMNHELLYKEARRLEELGIAPNMDLRMNIHEGCLAVTPFHGAISRLSEYVLALTNEKKGTVGLGVGRAILDSRLNDAWAIYAADFRDLASLESKLETIRQRKLSEARALLEERKVKTLSSQMQTQLEIMENASLVALTAKAMAATGRLARIINDDEVSAQILNELDNGRNLIIEGSHGTLLHPRFGFVPHVGQVDSTGAGILANLREIVHPQSIVRLGILATYSYRLGAGPLVSQDKEFSLLVDEDVDPDAEGFLGPFRIGPLDLVTLQYAVACVGGPKEYRGLAMSHFDHLNAFASEHKYWPICTGYTYHGEATNLDPYFVHNNGLITRIRVFPDTNDDAQQQHQRKLTALLKDCQPVIERITGPSAQAIEQQFVARVEREIGIPIVITAHGPDTLDVQMAHGHESMFV